MEVRGGASLTATAGRDPAAPRGRSGVPRRARSGTAAATTRTSRRPRPELASPAGRRAARRVRPRRRPGDLPGPAQPLLGHQPRPLGHDPPRLGLAGDRLHGRLQHRAAHRDGDLRHGGPSIQWFAAVGDLPVKWTLENRSANPGINARRRVLHQRPVDRLHPRDGRRHVRARVLGGADLLLDLQPVPRGRRRRAVPRQLQPDRRRPLRGGGARAADQARARAASCSTTCSRCTPARAARPTTSRCSCAARWPASTPCRRAWPRCCASTGRAWSRARCAG